MNAGISQLLGLAATQERRFMRGIDLGFLSVNWTSILAFDLVSASAKAAVLIGLGNTVLLFVIKGVELYFRIRELRRAK